MLELWQSAILGLVEGITEYLPISSTGHLIIAVSLLGLDRTEEQREAINAYTIVIQGGAILAVLGLYRKRVGEMIRGLLGRHAVGRKLAINLFIAFLPAAVFGVLLNERIERLLFRPGPVIGALAVGGVIMIFLTQWQRRFFHGDEHAEPTDAHSFVDIEHLTWRRALILATADQSLLEVLGVGPAVVGFLLAMLSAMVAIRWLVGFLERHGVAVFGWYRLVLAAVLTFLLVTGRSEIAPATTPARQLEPAASNVPAPAPVPVPVPDQSR
jgi:undecaprenyl-diphosphatase